MADISGASHLETDNPTHCQIKPFASATAVFTRDNRRRHRSLGNMLAAPFGNTVEIPEVEFRGEVKVEPGGGDIPPASNILFTRGMAVGINVSRFN